MTHKIFLSIALIFGLTLGAQAADMLDLPVNPKTTAMTYVYCLTGDNTGAADLLRQRYRYIGETEKNARAHARQWVASGYCSEFMAAYDQRAPQMRERVFILLAEAGFNAQTPISQQAAKSGREGKKKLGGIIGKIGKFLGSLFKAPSVCVGCKESYLETTTTGADGSSSTSRSCDSSTIIDIGGGGGADFDPTPYFPT